MFLSSLKIGALKLGGFVFIGLSTSCYEGGDYLTNRLPFHCEMKKNQVTKEMSVDLPGDKLADVELVAGLVHAGLLHHTLL